MKSLNIEEIEKILPQKYPFLFIDKVIELEEGKRIVAVKNVTVNEQFFQGHFPGHLVMPGTLIIEAMAQASILLYHSKFYKDISSQTNYYLGSVKVSFKQPVVPGDQLRLEGYATKLLITGAFVDVCAFVEDIKVAHGELVFSVKQ